MSKRKKSTWAWLALISLPTVVIAALGLALACWPARTLVRLKLTGKALEFRVDDSLPARAAGESALLPIAFKTLSVQHARSVDLSLESGLRQLSTITYPTAAKEPSTIRRFPHPTHMSVSGRQESLVPTFTVDRVASSAPKVGSLESLNLPNGATASLAVLGQSADEMNVVLQSKHPTCSVGLNGRCLLATENCITEISGRRNADAHQIYAATALRANPCATVIGCADRLSFYLTLANEPVRDIMADVPIRICSIAFLSQTAHSGEPATSLVRDGRLTYPDYPGVRARSIPRSALLDVAGLSHAQIDRITMTRGQPGFLVDMQMEIPVPKGSLSRYRLTQMDVLRAELWPAVLLGVVLWVFPTTITVIQFIREVTE